MAIATGCATGSRTAIRSVTRSAMYLGWWLEISMVIATDCATAGGASLSTVASQLAALTFGAPLASSIDLPVAATDDALKAFRGGFSDGTYGYAIPNYNSARFGKVARFSLADFATVQILDLTATDSNLKGFHEGGRVHRRASLGTYPRCHTRNP